MKNISVLLFCLLMLPVLAFGVPKGWYKAGNNPDGYVAGVENGVGPGGSRAATLTAIRNDVKGYVTLEQSVKPGNFRGKKIRLSAYMKSEDVDSRAVFFLRVDGAPGQGNFETDNMEDHPVKGTTGWTRYEVVVNVSDDAKSISFGTLLQGPGKIWFTHFRLEEIKEPTPRRGTLKYYEPVNPDFAE